MKILLCVTRRIQKSRNDEPLSFNPFSIPGPFFVAFGNNIKAGCVSYLAGTGSQHKARHIDKGK